MPFVSKAEARWGHTAEGEKALGGAAKLKEWDDATDFSHLPEKKAMKHHEYSSTTTHHFKDGSGHTTHHHHSDPKKNKEYAFLDHKGMMAGMDENLGGGPAPEEEAAAAPGAAGGAAPMPGEGAV